MWKQPILNWTREFCTPLMHRPYLISFWVLYHSNKNHSKHRFHSTSSTYQGVNFQYVLPWYWISSSVLFYFYFTFYCILWSISKKKKMMINVAELEHLEILNVYTFPPVRIHLTSNSLKEFGLFKSELTYFVDLKTPNLREANYNYI